MAYYSPEDDFLPGQHDPRFNSKQAPPLGYHDDDGVFHKRLTQSNWIESGTTARFSFRVDHVTDGAIQPASLALSFLDRGGNPYTLGISIGTITLLPGTENTYYADVQFSSDVTAGDYVSSWSGTYTPIGSVTALAIAMKWPFKVKQTVAPSQYFFWDTAKASQS